MCNTLNNKSLDGWRERGLSVPCHWEFLTLPLWSFFWGYVRNIIHAVNIQNLMNLRERISTAFTTLNQGWYKTCDVKWSIILISAELTLGNLLKAWKTTLFLWLNIDIFIVYSYVQLNSQVCSFIHIGQYAISGTRLLIVSLYILIICTLTISTCRLDWSSWQNIVCWSASLMFTYTNSSSSLPAVSQLTQWQARRVGDIWWCLGAEAKVRVGDDLYEDGEGRLRREELRALTRLTNGLRLRAIQY